MKVWLSLIVLSVLLFSSVNGAEIRPGTIAEQLCPRDTGLFTDIIKNTDSQPQNFNFNLQGGAKVWSTVVPSGVILGPGEQKVIYTYVTPGKNAVPGTYTLDLVSSGSGEVKSLSHPVTIKSCYGAQLVTPDAQKSVCPLELSKFEFELKNSGQYRETFDLSVEGILKDKVSLSDTAITLDKSGTKKIVAFVTGPEDAGEFGFSIVAKAKSSNIVESFNAKLQVNPCFDFLVEVEKSAYDFCEHTVQQVPIKITNRGTATNDFDLGLEGPEWAKLDNRFLELKPGESRIINLAMAPDFGVQGDFTISLDVVPEKGRLKAVHDFNVNVRKCNAVGVNIIEDKSRVCNGISGSFETIIKNIGEIENEFRLGMQAPGWVTLGQASPVFKLKSQEEKHLFIRMDPGLDVAPGTHKVRVGVSTTDESSVTAFSEDTIDVEVVGVEGCFKPSIEVDRDNVIVFFDATSTLPFAIKNNGITTAEYNVVVSGTASNFVQLNPSILRVEPGRSEIVYMYIAPSSQVALGDYEAVVSVRLKDSDFLVSQRIGIGITDNPEKVTVVEQVVEKNVANENKTIEVSTDDRSLAEIINGMNDRDKSKLKLVVGLIAILIVLILLIKFGVFRKMTNFFYDEVEE